MDGHLYVWARRQEIDRELVRLARVAEAREALEAEDSGGEHAHAAGGRGDNGRRQEPEQAQ